MARPQPYIGSVLQCSVSWQYHAKSTAWIDMSWRTRQDETANTYVIEIAI
jgi:hypothetical protein